MKRFGLAIALTVWTAGCSEVVGPAPSGSGGGCEYWEYDCIGTTYGFAPAKYAIDLDGHFGALTVSDATTGRPLGVTIDIPDAKPAPTFNEWREDEGAWAFTIEFEEDRIEYRVKVATEANSTIGLSLVNWCVAAGRRSVGLVETFDGIAVSCRIWRADLLVTS